MGEFFIPAINIPPKVLNFKTLLYQHKFEEASAMITKYRVVSGFGNLLYTDGCGLFFRFPLLKSHLVDSKLIHFLDFEANKGY